ncbi:MAG: RrF2 family transcriptional regulator [Candidatus Dormibacteria bacterium]
MVSRQPGDHAATACACGDGVGVDEGGAVGAGVGDGEGDGDAEAEGLEPADAVGDGAVVGAEVGLDGVVLGALLDGLLGNAGTEGSRGWEMLDGTTGADPPAPDTATALGAGVADGDALALGLRVTEVAPSTELDASWRDDVWRVTWLAGPADDWCCIAAMLVLLTVSAAATRPVRSAMPTRTVLKVTPKIYRLPRLPFRPSTTRIGNGSPISNSTALTSRRASLVSGGAGHTTSARPDRLGVWPDAPLEAPRAQGASRARLGLPATLTMGDMRVSVKADYAVRASIELAAHGPGPVSAEHIGESQNIPLTFLHNILAELKEEGLVVSHRGVGGGFELARDPDTITLGDVIRVIDGPLARVGDYRPDQLAYTGHTEALRNVWVAVRSYIRDVLDAVTLAQVVRGDLPPVVTSQTARRDAWVPRIKIDTRLSPQLGVPGHGGRQGSGGAGTAGPVARAPMAAIAEPGGAAGPDRGEPPTQEPSTPRS